MAQDINKVIIIGRLTKDVELQAVGSGISKATFSIASSGIPKSDGTAKTNFPRIVAWRKTAEFVAKYMHKGDRLCVEGHIETGSYEKGGQTVYTTDIVADHIQSLTQRNAQEQPAQAAATAGPEDFTEVNDDQLPF